MLPVLRCRLFFFLPVVVRIVALGGGHAVGMQMGSSHGSGQVGSEHGNAHAGHNNGMHWNTDLSSQQELKTVQGIWTMVTMDVNYNSTAYNVYTHPSPHLIRTLIQHNEKIRFSYKFHCQNPPRTEFHYNCVRMANLTPWDH